MKIILSFIALLFLSSCIPEGQETGRYQLTNEEELTIPYLAEEIVAFSYSNGFEFDLKVSSKDSKIQKSETHHAGDNYFTYETLTTTLKSNVPELTIALTVFPLAYSPLMSVEINGYFFEIDLSTPPEWEKLILGEKEYDNVYQAVSKDSDAEIIKPEKVYFSKETGIIQIIMTNDEKFTVKDEN
ncbi:hypothetical protein [uncultured Cyclobacterium sp.]|uniref:hypothetical protein n=1 Tax=uncultured Cyclobacterium sp. TaxID=453820 RepID=UPI0030EC015E|tara:strand:+ start:42616 stop:43170 length:555 start_codon:yes stop_codon:yes gene_type:complete